MIWDCVIVGAGSAGCALASELVKSDKKILVIEAGGWDRSLFIKIPAGQLRAAADYDWGYRSQPDPSRKGAIDDWRRGRVLGGSSSINGMIYVRGAAEDFDRWSDQCGSKGGWSAADVMPLFREFEASDKDGLLRGHNGPLHVETVRHPHRITEAFVKSAGVAGYPFNDDYNGQSQAGVAYLQRSLRRGFRCSAADAFLKPHLGRKNLRLLLHASVQKIEVADGHASAVSFVHRGAKRREMARDIVLCAGAINSPKLLMLSGIGDAEHLKHHYIDIKHDLPGVGHNLIEHPILRIIHRSRIPTYNLTEGLLQKVGIILKFITHREGPLSVPYESVGFLRTQSSAEIPDLMLHFAPIGVAGKIGGSMALAPYPAFMTCIAKIHPASSGCIRLASSNPDDAPLIECRLLSDQSDVHTLVRGIRTMRRVMSEDPIASLIETEITPGAAIDKDEALQEYVRTHTEISMHPLGTCRMGVGADAVVGPDLRVRGIDNLWIADASVMPDHISANLNPVCIMVGMKLGKQLAARA